MSMGVHSESLVVSEECPWCGSEIERAKFLEIQSRIAEHERRKLAELAAIAEAKLRAESERKLATLTAERDAAKTTIGDLEAREAKVRLEAAAAAEARVKEDVEKKLAAVAAERDAARTKISDLEAREAKVRLEAAAAAEARVKEDAEKKLAAVAAERDAARTKISDLEAREAKIRQDAAAQAEMNAKQEVEKKVAAVAAERDVANAKAKAIEVEKQKELEQQRLALEKDRDERLLKLQAEQNRGKEQLQQKLDAAIRQLQKKTANELGEGAEIDVYEALRREFARDDITRVKKGQPGADIRHGVLYKGASCGTVLLDSKNRQGWQHSYVTKLREDQVAAKAEHAVLATTVFPSGRKELYVDHDTGVIVVQRSRAVEIVRLLREAMVRMYQLNLSQSERAEKREKLYKYMTSDLFQQHLQEATRLSDEILELDVEEQRAHSKIWQKRGKLATRLRAAVRDVDTEVSSIIEESKGKKSAKGSEADDE